MRDYKFDVKCPHCGRENTMALEVGKDEESVPPSPGALLLCAMCGEWSVVGEDGRARVPTIEEYIEIGFDENCRRAREAWVRMDQKRKRDEAERVSADPRDRG